MIVFKLKYNNLITNALKQNIFTIKSIVVLLNIVY